MEANLLPGKLGHRREWAGLGGRRRVGRLRMGLFLSSRDAHGVLSLLRSGEVAEALGLHFAGLPRGLALGVAFGGPLQHGRIGLGDAEVFEQVG